MNIENELINKLLEKKEAIKQQLDYVNEDLVRAYINECLEQFALDMKENGVPFPQTVHLSFEDAYDDGGGTDKQLKELVFYGENETILNLRFKVERENSFYEETLHYIIWEAIRGNFGLDELEVSLGDDVKIALR